MKNENYEEINPTPCIHPALESDQKLRQPTGNAEKVADGESQIDSENIPEVESSSSTRQTRSRTKRSSTTQSSVPGPMKKSGLNARPRIAKT